MFCSGVPFSASAFRAQDQPTIYPAKARLELHFANSNIGSEHANAAGEVAIATGVFIHLEFFPYRKVESFATYDGCPNDGASSSPRTDLIFSCWNVNVVEYVPEYRCIRPDISWERGPARKGNICKVYQSCLLNRPAWNIAHSFGW